MTVTCCPTSQRSLVVKTRQQHGRPLWEQRCGICPAPHGQAGKPLRGKQSPEKSSCFCHGTSTSSPPAWGRSAMIRAEQLVLEKPCKDEDRPVKGLPRGASSSRCPRLPALRQIPNQTHQDPPALIRKSRSPTPKTPHPVTSASSETGSWKSLQTSQTPGMPGAKLGSGLLSQRLLPCSFPPCGWAQEHPCGPAAEWAGESAEHLRFTPDLL